MEEKDIQKQTPINVWGVANIGCSMESPTFQTLAAEPKATKNDPVGADGGKSGETACGGTCPHGAEELFHFIHPSVDSREEWQIHEEVKRLVTRQGIQEICQYLKQLADDRKILLPQNAERAYNELVRMGMPDGEGYSLKTFQKYYKK
jgi:hypothetical protein